MTFSLCEPLRKSDSKDSFPCVLSNKVVVKFIRELEAMLSGRELWVVIEIAT
jgi:hypothetical protein